MSCFVTPEGLEFLLHGNGAPLWHAITTPGWCIAVNALAYIVLVLCSGFIARRLCFWYEAFDFLEEEAERSRPRPHYAPYLVMAAFAAVPQFAEKLTQLSPFLFSLVPSFLSGAVIASLNTRSEPVEGPEEELRDGRRFVMARMALAGALAAVGAWEGTCGLFAAPLLLVAAGLPFIRRDQPVTVVSAVWLLAFAGVFFAEHGYIAGCPWSAMLPRRVEVAGFVVFLFTGVMPLAVVRTLGENRWTLRGWAAVIVLAFGAILLTGNARFAFESASERFVRHVLADVGERRYLFGDGIFDVMFDVCLPEGVERIGARTPAECEFLVNLVGKEPVTNRIVVVNRYYGFEEMAAVSREIGIDLERRSPEADGQLSAEKRLAIEKESRAELERRLKPLCETLRTVEGGFANVPERLLEAEIDKARENIRKGWMNGFRGLRMSMALLSLDFRRGDMKALETDAIMALVMNQEDPVANSLLGNLRLGEGKLEAAERYLRLGAAGGGIGACNDLAMLLVKTERYEEAEKWARQAVSKAPADWNLHETLARALIGRGRFEDALRELDAVERLAKEQKQLGQVRDSLERNRAAIEKKLCPARDR